MTTNQNNSKYFDIAQSKRWAKCLMEKYGSEAWLAKIDLADAYSLVPLRLEEWKFLGMKIDGNYYIDRTLPKRASSSIHLSQQIIDCLKSILYHTSYFTNKFQSNLLKRPTII